MAGLDYLFIKIKTRTDELLSPCSFVAQELEMAFVQRAREAWHVKYVSLARLRFLGDRDSRATPPTCYRLLNTTHACSILGAETYQTPHTGVIDILCDMSSPSATPGAGKPQPSANKGKPTYIASSGNVLET